MTTRRNHDGGALGLSRPRQNRDSSIRPQGDRAATAGALEPQGYHARHSGLLAPTCMADARVVLFGDGSLGSMIAWFLVRAGLGTLVHYDNELVEETNLCRTAYGERDIGQPKTDALDGVLRAIRSDVTLEGHHEDLREVSDDALDAQLTKANLVVIATDHPPTQARVAARSYFRVPAVIPGVYAKGTGGEVVVTLPNESACWHCVFAGIRTEEQPDRGTTDYGLTTGQLKAEPALGVDIANVAVAAAALAIAVLHRGTGLPLGKRVQAGRNILFVGNVIDWAFQDYNESFWAHTTRRPDCPVCGTPAVGHPRPRGPTRS